MGIYLTIGHLCLKPGHQQVKRFLRTPQIYRSELSVTRFVDMILMGTKPTWPTEAAAKPKPGPYLLSSLGN